MSDQTEFVEHVKGIVEYWSQQPGKTDYEKCDGVAFSILNLLDGYSGGMPPYEVRPIDEDGKVGEDIGGSLHSAYSSSGTGEEEA